MNTQTTLLGLALLMGGIAGVRAQDTPQDIPKKELPKKAVCVICDFQSNAHGEEKAAAGVRYKGKTYYFCNTSEVATFKKDPEGYMPPVLPRPAPEFSLKTLDEKTVTKADYKDKILLVDYWATHCKPCVETMPELQKLSQKYADKDVIILGVSIDDEGAKVVKPFVTKRKFTYTMALDTGKDPAWKEFKVRGIPALFLIDKEGQIVKQWSGKPKKGEVEAAIKTLIESSP
jgi:peroxiredoxin/YHS domain-containing protein